MKKFDKLFNNIIKEAEDDLAEGAGGLDENFNDKEEKEVDKSNIALKFTNNLAAEFVQVMNEFSKIGAEMVKTRDVDKDKLDKFKDLHSKIKNLIDASENSK